MPRQWRKPERRWLQILLQHLIHSHSPVYQTYIIVIVRYIIMLYNEEVTKGGRCGRAVIKSYR